MLPGYFETLRIPLLRGRYFAAQDRPGSEPVALIDDSFAQRFFTGLDPIGQRLKMPWGTFTIAGIVGGVKSTALDLEIRPTIYFSGQQTPIPGLTLVIRSQLPMTTIEESIQRIVARIDRMSRSNVMPCRHSSIGRSRQALYCVAHERLRERRHRAGGAGPLRPSVVCGGLRRGKSYQNGRRREWQQLPCWCRGGIPWWRSSGLAAMVAVGTRHLIASQLYGTQFEDAGTWAAVLGIVTAMGLLACAEPAWRAARTNPVNALRDE